jgi:hypothetical protein
MSTGKMKVLLTGLEAEVVGEALELYLQARPVPMDARFEYRYRAAQSVLQCLRQGNRDLGTFARGDDEDASPVDDVRPGRRTLRDRTED